MPLLPSLSAVVPRAIAALTALRGHPGTGEEEPALRLMVPAAVLASAEPVRIAHGVRDALDQLRLHAAPSDLVWMPAGILIASGLVALGEDPDDFHDDVAATARLLANQGLACGSWTQQIVTLLLRLLGHQTITDLRHGCERLGAIHDALALAPWWSTQAQPLASAAILASSDAAVGELVAQTIALQAELQRAGMPHDVAGSALAVLPAAGIPAVEGVERLDALLAALAEEGLRPALEACPCEVLLALLPQPAPLIADRMGAFHTELSVAHLGRLTRLMASADLCFLDLAPVDGHLLPVAEPPHLPRLGRLVRLQLGLSVLQVAAASIPPVVGTPLG